VTVLEKLGWRPKRREHYKFRRLVLAKLKKKIYSSIADPSPCTKIKWLNTGRVPPVKKKGEKKSIETALIVK
jgi:hypothetical protein